MTTRMDQATITIYLQEGPFGHSAGSRTAAEWYGTNSGASCRAEADHHKARRVSTIERAPLADSGSLAF